MIKIVLQAFKIWENKIKKNQFSNYLKISNIKI